MCFIKEKRAMCNELNKLIKNLQVSDLAEPLPQRLLCKLIKKQAGQILGRDQKAELRFIKTRI